MLLVRVCSVELRECENEVRNHQLTIDELQHYKGNAEVMLQQQQEEADKVLKQRVSERNYATQRGTAWIRAHTCHTLNIGAPELPCSVLLCDV